MPNRTPIQALLFSLAMLLAASGCGVDDTELSQSSSAVSGQDTAWTWHNRFVNPRNNKVQKMRPWPWGHPDIREFAVWAPADASSTQPRPVVFWFHGATAFLGKLRLGKGHKDNAEAMRALAKDNGFIMVTAKGLNYPTCQACKLVPGTYDERVVEGGEEVCGNNKIMALWDIERVDGQNRDVRLFDTMLAHVTANHNIDTDRVYVAGHSFGAFFTHLLAKVRSDKIAAIATHAAGLDVEHVRVIKCPAPFNFFRDGVNAARKYPAFLARRVLDPSIPQLTVQRAKCALEAEGHTVVSKVYTDDCDRPQFAACCPVLYLDVCTQTDPGAACATATSNQHGVVPSQFGPDAWSFLSTRTLNQ